MDNPIIILGIPRSGTSMTAGLFAAHGVWTGQCKKPTKMNPRGFFENVGIRELIRKRWGGHQTEARRIAKPMNGWRALVEAEIRKQGYSGGPWLVKHSVVGWPIWHEFAPHFICVRRENVRKSFSAWFRSDNPDQVIDFSERQMDTVVERGGVNVFADAIVKGDYGSLETAFEKCGLQFDPEKADQFVDRALWHY